MKWLTVFSYLEKNELLVQQNAFSLLNVANTPYRSRIFGSKSGDFKNAVVDASPPERIRTRQVGVTVMVAKGYAYASRPFWFRGADKEPLSSDDGRRFDRLPFVPGNGIQVLSYPKKHFCPQAMEYKFGALSLFLSATSSPIP